MKEKSANEIEYSVKQSYMRLLNHIPGLAYRCRIVSPGGKYSSQSESVLEFVSHGAFALLEIHSADMIKQNWNAIERMMPEEDLQRTRQMTYEAVEGQTSYSIIYRLSLESGKIKWIWDQGEGVYCEKTGEPLFLEGLLMDISEHKYQELHLLEENRLLKSSVPPLRTHFDNIIGKSDVMQQVFSFIEKAGQTDMNVIIYGETGCGKDLVARAIHNHSKQSGKYISVNCGAIPENLMESEFFGHVKGAFTGAYSNKEGFIAAADGGTLFLDELGELPMHLQVKLLRVLENRTYLPVGSNIEKKSTFRLITATNQDLLDMVKKKQMRMDFYYRVNVLSITLPPLRDRKSDIPLLLEGYLAKKGESRSIPFRVLASMEEYFWPGNIRELHNFIDRYLLFGDAVLSDLGEAALPDTNLTIALPHMTLEAATERLERNMISQVLEQCHWHKGNTAVRLGITLRTLQRKMKKLGI